MKNQLLGALCALAFLPLAATARDSQQMEVFGKKYRPVVQASADQAQVVYYRPGTPVDKNTGPSAHLYIDGEFHTGLVPGGYTVFCVRPGTHQLGVWYKEGPQFAGKRSTEGAVEMEAGKTYFLDAGSADDSGILKPVNLKTGEEELVDNRMQAHVVSRASAVVPCSNRYGGYVVSENVADGLTYALPLDVLFAFNRSDREGITPEGQVALDRLVAEFKGKPGDFTVTGHADSIGGDDAAQALGLARAETVRAILLAAGATNVEARSAGNRELRDPNCGKKRTASNINCQTQNRRVRIELR